MSRIKLMGADGKEATVFQYWTGAYDEKGRKISIGFPKNPNEECEVVVVDENPVWNKSNITIGEGRERYELPILSKEPLSRMDEMSIAKISWGTACAYCKAAGLSVNSWDSIESGKLSASTVVMQLHRAYITKEDVNLDDRIDQWGMTGKSIFSQIFIETAMGLIKVICADKPYGI